MTRSADTALDAAVAQARALRLDDAVVRARADECARWALAAERAPRPFAWWWPAGAALAAAAAIVALVVRPAPPSSPLPEAAAAPIVGIGARVAIVASPGAAYRVLAATAERTDISIASGAVTARLYPGAAPHRLVLIGGGIEASATGTIYTLVVPASRAPYVVVHEGQVGVHDPSGEHAVPAGHAWPDAAPGAAFRAAFDAAAHELEHHQLAELAAASASTTGSAGGPDDGRSGSDASSIDRRGSASTGWAAGTLPPGGATADTAPPTGATTIDDRWRRARQLRGQGHPREALAMLDQLIRRGDPIWSPIAIAEAMRIHASVLADPRAVVGLGTGFLDRYPKHALAREVTDMLCRAHRALGETELPSACLLRGAE